MALTLVRLRSNDFRQESFRRIIAVQYAILGAFLVVDDELHGNACTARPVRRRRLATVSLQVSWIVSHFLILSQRYSGTTER